MATQINNKRIEVVTPFTRKQNLPFLLKVIEGHAKWTVIIDDPSLKDIFPSWVNVKLYDKPPTRANLCKSNWLYNQFLAEGLDKETQYMLLNDDDSVEEGFWDKIPDEDVIICSMRRGQRVPANGVGYGWGDLIASPDNIGIGKVSGEQLIIKGKIMQDFRYGLNHVGDGVMIMRVVEEHPVRYIPDAYVLFNYFEDGRYDSFHRKPLVMFVGDLWCAANPKMGKSEWEGNIWASLESTGLVDVARFHFDKYYYHTGQRGDKALLENIERLKPDYIVLIMYKEPGNDPTVISLDTIANIKVPIISIWGDLEAEEQRYLAKALEPFMHKVVCTANKSIAERMNYTYMHVPKDPRIFNNPDKERDIDIVFSGSYGHGREERQKYMNYLLSNKVKLLHGGSEGGDHFTTEDYAERYKRAKLALSFSVARGMNVVNARPFEAMSCGAMLLEQESLELAKLYTPFVDYVPWTTEVDLLEKVRYYLEHDEERKKIAEAGHQKTKELYSALTFWKKTLEL